MTEQITTTMVGSGEKCAGAPFLSYLSDDIHTKFQPTKCVVCKMAFVPRRKDQKTCGKKQCRHAAPRLVIRAQEHIGFVEQQWARRRAKSRTELMNDLKQGPRTRDDYKHKTFKKDRATSPVGCDAHVEPAQPKFNQVTPEDVTWGERQSTNHSRYAARGDGAVNAYHPSRTLNKPKTNYCPLCKEYVRQDHEHI